MYFNSFNLVHYIVGHCEYITFLFVVSITITYPSIMLYP